MLQPESLTPLALPTLRAATDADAPHILNLEATLFGDDAWTPGLLAEELSGKGRTYLVAQLGSNENERTNLLAVGYAGIWVNSTVAEVMTIGVDPQQQGRGIGKALLQALIDAAIKQGAAEMFLEVQTDNAPAINLYEKFGFEPLAIRKRYYGTKDAYTMRLVLR